MFSDEQKNHLIKIFERAVSLLCQKWEAEIVMLKRGDENERRIDAALQKAGMNRDDYQLNKVLLETTRMQLEYDAMKKASNRVKPVNLVGGGG